MNRVRSFLLLVIAVAALAGIGLAQGANDAKAARGVLSNVAKTMGVDRLKTLHYSGTGSSYIVGEGAVPSGGWPHGLMKSYVCDLNLDAATSRLQLVRTEGTPPADKTIDQVVDADSPWPSQYAFWITPYGFLKGAMTNN